MLDPSLLWLGGGVAATAVEAVQSVAVTRRSPQRKRAREALLRRGFVEGPRGWELEVDDCRITVWEGLMGLDLDGPPVSSRAPNLVEREGADDDWAGSAIHVPSGDPDFDAAVLCEHPDEDEALGWLTYARRRAAMRAIASGAFLSRRWRQRIEYGGTVGELEEQLNVFVGACHAFFFPPSRAPHIALHPLTLDPLLGVRMRALGRLLVRDELPVSVGARMARETAEPPRLALIQTGGPRAVRLATRIMLCGHEPHRAAIALARVIRTDAYAAEAVDGVAEDLLVDRLLEALGTRELGLAAARALRGLYLPNLPQMLLDRYGPDAPPRVEALRWEMVCRYRIAWGDTWAPEVLQPPVTP